MKAFVKDFENGLSNRLLNVPVIIKVPRPLSTIGFAASLPSKKADKVAISQTYNGHYRLYIFWQLQQFSYTLKKQKKSWALDIIFCLFVVNISFAFWQLLKQLHYILYT